MKLERQPDKWPTNKVAVMALVFALADIWLPAVDPRWVETLAVLREYAPLMLGAGAAWLVPDRAGKPL